MIGRLAQIAGRIRSAENDVQFELDLVRIARIGLWFAGVPGLLVTLLFIATKDVPRTDRSARASVLHS